MGVDLLIFWRGIFYLFAALGLGTLGADLLRGLEEGHLALRSIADFWAAGGLPGIGYVLDAPDPGRVFLGQSAALFFLLLAGIFWAIGRQSARRYRRIFK